MKKEMKFVKCLFCGVHNPFMEGQPMPECSCVKCDKITIKDQPDVKSRIITLEGQMEEMTKSYLDLKAKHEEILNKMKCIECQSNHGPCFKNNVSKE